MCLLKKHKMGNFILNKFFLSDILPEINQNAIQNDSTTLLNFVVFEDVHYLNIYNSNEEQEGIILYFCGNKTLLSDQTQQKKLSELSRLSSYRVYAFDYRQNPNNMKSLDTLIESAIKFVKHIMSLSKNTSKIIGIGHSLGCSLLLHAAIYYKFSHIILFAPFVNPPSMVCNYCSPSTIWRYSCPSYFNNYYLVSNCLCNNVYIIVSTKDNVINPIQSKQLLNRFNSKTNITYVNVENYTHGAIVNINYIAYILNKL